MGPEDRAAAFDQTASQLGAMVADRVRTALESAERAAADVRRRALDQAASDRDALHGTAALVTARIDLIEAEVGQLLQELREEVARIVAEAERAADAPAHDAPAESERAPSPTADDPPASPAADDPPASPAEAAPPDPPADVAPPDAPAEAARDAPAQGAPRDAHAEAAARDAPAEAAAQRDPVPERRGGLFRRRARSRTCGVCGRTGQAADADFARWYEASGTSLCPECQAAGWRLPRRGRVPYRSAQPQPTSRS